jgi:tetraacyldisaccharide 4'-kinase
VITPLLKTILSQIYFLVWSLWRFLYFCRLLPVKRVNAFVVSIGNLSVGGTGKTPFTIFLAQEYQKRGAQVGIVSRGYGGKYPEPVAVVSDGKTIFRSAEAVGDEPYLMAKQLTGVPIIVSRDRFLGCQQLIEQFGVRTILLDDGFQHLRLHRDLNIMLIDTTKTNSFLLPKGPMREPLTAIHRADLVILTRTETPSESSPLITESGFAGPVLKIAFSPVELIQVENQTHRPLSALSGESILAFCGIGNPASFTNMLIRLGATLRETMLFRDHFQYTASDIQSITARAKALDITTIVTTEKDAVRLEHILGKPPLWALRIGTAFLEPRSVWEPFFFRVPGTLHEA